MNVKQWLSSLARYGSDEELTLTGEDATRFVTSMLALGFDFEETDAYRTDESKDYEIPLKNKSGYEPGDDVVVLQHWLFWTLKSKGLLDRDCVPDLPTTVMVERAET